MVDSYGDGWNGNTLQIFDCDQNSLVEGEPQSFLNHARMMDPCARD
jgi:hypothetical protein